MPRFFVTKEQLPVITGSDAHQIRNVLRMKPGMPLELFDGQGNVYQARIEEIKKERVTCSIISRSIAAQETKVKITLAQALPKGKKFEFIVQKATELGVDRIVPVITERSIGKGEKPERWQAIAKEAAEQSGRAYLPAVEPLVDFSEVIRSAKNYDLALIPWELEKTTSLKQTLKTYRPNHLLVLIGPEGGFSLAEVEQAKAAGFLSVSLGKTILRTETASLFTLSAIRYEFE